MLHSILLFVHINEESECLQQITENGAKKFCISCQNWAWDYSTTIVTFLEKSYKFVKLRNLAQIYLHESMVEFHEIRVIIWLVFSASHSNKWHIKGWEFDTKNHSTVIHQFQSNQPICSASLSNQNSLIFTNELKVCSFLAHRCCVCNRL